MMRFSPISPGGLRSIQYDRRAVDPAQDGIYPMQLAGPNGANIDTPLVLNIQQSATTAVYMDMRVTQRWVRQPNVAGGYYPGLCRILQV
jgi:hypothetical protein